MEYLSVVQLLALFSSLHTVSTQERFFRYDRVRGNGGAFDELQRGQEGLVIQVDHLSKSLKADELKLNNIFYKLGRHDTDIETNNDQQHNLQKNILKLEAKLNKQSFNVDFLRRHVMELKKSIGETVVASSAVSSLQKIVDNLQTSLAQSVYRTSELERKTKALESKIESGQAETTEENNNIYYASKSPKTTYYYMDGDTLTGVCDELNGWTTADNGDCLWVANERTNYTQAVAKCASKGSFLLTLHRYEVDWLQSYSRYFRENPVAHYWTSATSAFTNYWTFTSSDYPVDSQHWVGNVGSGIRIGNRKCGALTSSGLVANNCARENYYICQRN